MMTPEGEAKLLALMEEAVRILKRMEVVGVQRVGEVGGVVVRVDEWPPPGEFRVDGPITVGCPAHSEP